MTQMLEGRLFEAGSSRTVSARLCHDQRVFSILRGTDDTRDISWTRAETAISSPVAGLPQRFAFPDGSCFEAEPGAELDAFLSTLGLPGDTGWGFRRHPYLMGTAVVAVILMPVVLWFTFAFAADAVARSLPRAVDDAIGKHAFAWYDGDLFTPSELSASDRKRVRALFAETIGGAGALASQYRLYFRQSDLGANAIAFPGGAIILTDALVELSQHDDELAAVLAHEIAHVMERHGVRMLVRSLGLILLVQLFLGDSVSLLEEAATVGVGIASLAYSRDFELAADRRAAETMRKIGRDAARLITLLERLEQACGVGCKSIPPLLSTHPGLKTRLEAIRP